MKTIYDSVFNFSSLIQISKFVTLTTTSFCQGFLLIGQMPIWFNIKYLSIAHSNSHKSYVVSKNVHPFWSHLLKKRKVLQILTEYFTSITLELLFLFVANSLKNS